MLHTVVNTLNRTHNATSGTVVSLENPVSKRYRTLEIWEQLLKQPGWTMFTADHCMLASCMDADPIFPRKPTTWICRNAHDNVTTQAKACSKHGQRCRCKVPNTDLHQRVVCRPTKANPLRSGQTVLPNNANKARIPLGAFHLIVHGHIPPPADCADNAYIVDCHGCTYAPCHHNAFNNTVKDATDTTVDQGAIDVDAQLIPPSHHYRLDPLSPRFIWHRRYGHAQSPGLDRTADYVAGLTKHKSPAFCECCIRAKLRKKNASKDPAVRPNASEPLGQVSIDLVEFTVHKDETLATIDGYKYACVFVDGYSRHKHIYLMKTKDESLDALKDYCRHVGMHTETNTDRQRQGFHRQPLRTLLPRE